jgi:hypothetical protein
VVLLVAVFPANVYMAMHPAEAGAAGIAAVGASPSAGGPDLVAGLVYPAPLCGAMKRVAARMLSMAGGTGLGSDKSKE